MSLTVRPMAPRFEGMIKRRAALSGGMAMDTKSGPLRKMDPVAGRLFLLQSNGFNET
ncbi:MAG: hypothetical protein AAF307_07780 [Pseudomonadota bacterium]